MKWPVLVMLGSERPTAAGDMSITLVWTSPQIVLPRCGRARPSPGPFCLAARICPLCEPLGSLPVCH